MDTPEMPAFFILFLLLKIALVIIFILTIFKAFIAIQKRKMIAWLIKNK
jgi:hypothetical protein